MKVEYFKEYSHCLGKEMEFKVYGHAGKPCIAFPCQDGRFFDYENRGMIEIMKPYIEQGRLQVFCVDSQDIESWSAKWKNPRHRMETQEAYYNYIMNEIVPRVFDINTYGNGGSKASGIMTYGCSMGAYHAVNFYVRRPDVFDKVLALSGLYRTNEFFGDYHDDLTYLNSPIYSLEGIGNNQYYLDLYRKAQVIVCVGQGNWEDECKAETRMLQDQFVKNNIPAWFDYWGYDVPHDWPSWYKQTPYFLDFMI